MTTTTFAQSAPPRCRRKMATFERIDAALRDIACEMGATAMSYPTLIARDALVQAGYPEAFPHLLMLATSLDQPEQSAVLEPTNLASPQWCLSPAVCFHTYCQFAGRRLARPAIVTAAGRCFRHEASTDPGRRQIEFDMREIVLLGPGDWVRATATDCQNRLERAATLFELNGQWRIAEDPFFLPRAQGQALMQRLKESKLEYCLPDGLAIASVNFHGDFFARRFDIRDADGELIETACLAAGLDRWASNLKHGEVCSCQR
jgi:seryl-tRNA synthetase